LPPLPYAWRRAYLVYRHLMQRERDEMLAATAVDNTSAAMERQWSQAQADQAALLELKNRGELGTDATEFLSLQRGDFEPLTSRDADAVRFGGRRLDWMASADRIHDALQRWHGLSPEAKRVLPFTMAFPAHGCRNS
jgi:hypothetical protein